MLIAAHQSICFNAAGSEGDTSACCRGYLLTQVAGGVWADKFGGKPILGFGVIWWSVATALTPIAAQLGLPVRREISARGIQCGLLTPLQDAFPQTSNAAWHRITCTI